MLSGSTGSEFQNKVLLKIRLFGNAEFDFENLTLFRPLAQHSSVSFDVTKHFTTVTTFLLQFQREGVGSWLAETSRCLSRSRPFSERRAQRHHIIIIRDFEQVDNAASAVTSRQKEKKKGKKTERERERETERGFRFRNAALSAPTALICRPNTCKLWGWLEAYRKPKACQSDTYWVK